MERLGRPIIDTHQQMSQPASQANSHDKCHCSIRVNGGSGWERDDYGESCGRGGAVSAEGGDVAGQARKDCVFVMKEANGRWPLHLRAKPSQATLETLGKHVMFRKQAPLRVLLSTRRVGVGTARWLAATMRARRPAGFAYGP